MSLYSSSVDPTSSRIAVVVSQFNESITFALRDGALWYLEKCGLGKSQISTYYVPGAMELPYAARLLNEKKTYAAIICIGCVIRGGTPHFDYVCQGVSHAISAINSQINMQSPVIFGVLTVDTVEQAEQRACRDVKLLEASCQPEENRLNQAPMDQRQEGLFTKKRYANKGVEAAQAALQMIELRQRIEAQL